MMIADLRKIPAVFGVYLLRNWENEIIYVGASHKQRGGLRTRIKSYFSKSDSKLKIDPFEISTIEWMREDQNALWIEENIIYYLHSTGHPIRNILIKNIKLDLYDDQILTKFNKVSIWNDPKKVRIVALERQKARKFLIEGIKGMTTKL